MSAEFYIYFEPKEWYLKNKSLISQKLKKLNTYNGFNKVENAFYLISPKHLGNQNYEYDVRFFEEETSLFFELSFHDESLKHDLADFFKWLRTQVEIQIEDEDGVQSNW